MKEARHGQGGLRGIELEVRIGTEIRSIGIPPRPQILDRIAAEMRKTEPDFRTLALVIGSDVSLAASVIKVANSPYFGFSKRVRSVPEALLLLGLKVTINTIAGIELHKTFAHVPHLDRFWDSATKEAHASAWLAKRLHGNVNVRPDDAYTYALFRDCGIPILLGPFPEYRQILQRANAEATLVFTAIEEEALSVNHAVIGSAMAKDWLLPEETAAAIQGHHDVAMLAASSGSPAPPAHQLIAIAQFVEHLIQKHTGLSQTREWDKLGPACLAVLGITPELVAVLEDESREIIASSDP